MDAVIEIKEKRQAAKAELALQTQALKVALKKKRKLKSAARNSYGLTS